jgi:hypothetical protein
LATPCGKNEERRRRVLLRDVHARGRVGGTRPARHEAESRPAGRLADRLRHDRGAAFVPADGDRERTVLHGVARRDVALARHAEHMLRAMNDELVDQDFAAGARSGVGEEHGEGLRRNGLL